MQVLRLYWVGTRTFDHDATVTFFRDTLGLRVRFSENDFTVLEVPDGASVEVFGPTSPYNEHFTTPVVGFLVSSLDEAVRELRNAGIEVVMPVKRGDTGAWLHFRAPDGFTYELSEEW